MIKTLRLLNLWVLALYTIHATPLQSTPNSAPALGLILPSTLAVKPAPTCAIPEYLRPRRVAAVVLSDCLLPLFEYLLDPMINVQQKRDSSTPVSVKKDRSCSMGVIPVPRATRVTSRFSLLDEAIAGAMIVRRCIEGGTVKIGGHLYVGRNENWVQVVLNPVDFLGSNLSDHIPLPTLPTQVAASFAPATSPTPSFDLALLSSSNSSASFAVTLSAGRIQCFEGPSTPSISGTDCLYMFYDLLSQPGVNKYQRWGGTSRTRVEFSHGRCLMVLSETSEMSLDVLRLSDLLIAAAKILSRCVAKFSVRHEGGQTLVGVREQFVLTLSGEAVVGSISANTNQTAVIGSIPASTNQTALTVVEDVASS